MYTPHRDARAEEWTCAFCAAVNVGRFADYRGPFRTLVVYVYSIELLTD